jgi:predicted nucleic acid binding AN1-type Zn finger protein
MAENVTTSRRAWQSHARSEHRDDNEEITMRCYECAKLGTAEPAVAVCRSCSAGLCLTHLRETANFLATGAIRPSCQHDTWLPTRGARLRAPRPPTRSKQTLEVAA